MKFQRIQTIVSDIVGAVGSSIAGIAQQAASALAWFVMLGLGGSAMIVTGIAMLFGLGWAFIAGGVFMLIGSAFIRKGMNV